MTEDLHGNLILRLEEKDKKTIVVGVRFVSIHFLFFSFLFFSFLFFFSFSYKLKKLFISHSFSFFFLFFRRATNLDAKDSNGLSDPYCILYYRGKKHKTKVRVKRKSAI